MGTSSSYRGPTGRSPLLPPWAEDPSDEAPPENQADNTDDNGEDQQDTVPDGNIPMEAAVEPSVTWRAPKHAISRLAHKGGNTATVGAFRTLGRSYVRASGGAHTAAIAARSGRATTALLGNLFATGMREGFRQAAERLGLHNLLGQDAGAVLAAFVDLLAPAGALREEAAARTALIETLETVFDRYEVQTGGLDALDHVDNQALSEIIELSVVNYVNARIQQDLVNRIERGTLPEREANQLMDEICDFIHEVVKLDVAGVDLVDLDWKGAAGRQLVMNTYTAAYALLGAET